MEMIWSILQSIADHHEIKICEASTPAREFSKHLSKKILKKMGRAAASVCKKLERTSENLATLDTYLTLLIPGFTNRELDELNDFSRQPCALVFRMHTSQLKPDRNMMNSSNHSLARYARQQKIIRNVPVI
jgi:hypothetical protein